MNPAASDTRLPMKAPPPMPTLKIPEYSDAATSAASGATVSSTVWKARQTAVSQRIPAGTSGQALCRGTTARIFTGAPIPAQADAVVAQEDVTVNEDGSIRFTKPVVPGTWVRRRACDIASGSVVAEAGCVLEPAVLGLVASVGCGYVKVYRHLRVGVFFSGSELVAPGEPLPEGGIYNSNRYTIRA